MKNLKEELEKYDYKNYGVSNIGSHQGAILYQKKICGDVYLNIYEYDCTKTSEGGFLYSAECSFMQGGHEYTVSVSLRGFKNLQELEDNIIKLFLI